MFQIGEFQIESVNYKQHMLFQWVEIIIYSKLTNPVIGECR